jgi:predicted carbohydrate-binding protein with CBM5 and CBM33 domain
MQFYNLKTRSYVDVPTSDVCKTKMVRKTKTGEQTRYALTANHQGSKLYKFVSKETYDQTEAKEV